MRENNEPPARLLFLILIFDFWFVCLLALRRLRQARQCRRCQDANNATCKEDRPTVTGEDPSPNPYTSIPPPQREQGSDAQGGVLYGPSDLLIIKYAPPPSMFPLVAMAEMDSTVGNAINSASPMPPRMPDKPACPAVHSRGFRGRKERREMKHK